MFLLFKYGFMFWNQFYFVAMEKGLYITLAYGNIDTFFGER